VSGVPTNDNIVYMTETSGSAQTAILKSTDGAYSFKQENVSNGLVFLAIAAATEQHVVATGLTEEYYTTDGRTFKNSLGPAAVNEKVDCAKVLPTKSPLGSFQFGIAGKFGSTNGVGVSTTGGIEYNAFGPTEAQLNSTKFGIRKADFPSSSTWYATFGSAPAPPPSPPMEGFPEADTRRVRFGPGLTAHVNTATGNTTLTNRWAFDEAAAAAFSTPFTAVDGSEGSGGAAKPGGETYDSGYAMAVAKTTDAGKTWSIVYQVRFFDMSVAYSCQPL
jgi:hypothetical protein